MYMSFIPLESPTSVHPHLIIACHTLTDYYDLEHSVPFRLCWVRQAPKNLIENWLKWLWC